MSYQTHQDVSEIVKDSFIVDKFIEVLSDYAEMQSALGERDRAFLVSKAAQVIQILTTHCNNYNIGIPALQIQHVVSQK